MTVPKDLRPNYSVGWWWSRYIYWCPVKKFLNKNKCFTHSLFSSNLFYGGPWDNGNNSFRNERWFQKGFEKSLCLSVSLSASLCLSVCLCLILNGRNPPPRVNKYQFLNQTLTLASAMPLLRAISLKNLHRNIIYFQQ